MKYGDDGSVSRARQNPRAWVPATAGAGMVPFWGWQRLERVRERASKLQQARGSTDRTNLQDWLQAEREIDGEE